MVVGVCTEMKTGTRTRTRTGTRTGTGTGRERERKRGGSGSGDRDGSGNENGHRSGDRNENREGEREKTELKNSPHHDRRRVEEVEEGLTPTGNQHYRRDLMHDGARRVMWGMRSQGREGRSKNRKWGRGGMMRENLPKRCKGKTENVRRSGDRNRKRRRNIFAAVVLTQTSKTEARKQRGKRRALEGSRRVV